MMTIATTIGYGTFAPSLPFGRSMVILFGSVTIVLFGLVSRPAVDLVEAIEARTELLLLRARRSDQPLSEQGQKMLKGASAMLLCHAVLMAAAVIVYLDRDEEDPLHEEWDYGTCYYFCFVTFSSIGLGDFSLGPADNSNYELGRLLVQALIIMFGIASFNVATGACSDLVLPLGAAFSSQLRAWAAQLGTRVATPCARSRDGQKVELSPATRIPMAVPFTSWKVSGLARRLRSPSGCTLACDGSRSRASIESEPEASSTLMSCGPRRPTEPAAQAAPADMPVPQFSSSPMPTPELLPWVISEPFSEPISPELLPWTTASAEDSEHTEALHDNVEAPPTATPAPPASPPMDPELPPQPGPAPSSQTTITQTTLTQTVLSTQTPTPIPTALSQTTTPNPEPPAAEAQPSRCKQRLRACLAVIGYLAIFYAMILIGAVVFVHVEAATEEAGAITMRLEENEVRESMGLERLSVGASGGLPLSPPSAPPELRPASREEAAAALAALRQTPAEERGPAIDSIVGDYVQVVKNEAAADSLAEFFLARLDTCKSRSADYTQPRWTFEGATFFMMTIATSIGYGTFAPKTPLGKAIVVLIGHLTMIFYGVCLSALVNEVTAAIEWVASMMLFVSGKVARVIRYCGGPELVASSEQEARYKLLVAIGLLHGYLGICAVCAQTVFGDYLDTEISFDEGYYFGFVTFSTIGFGDFALQPYGAPSSLIFFEALAVFAGLAFFSAFASHGAAWINEVAPIAWAMDPRRLLSAFLRMAHSVVRLPLQLSHAFSTVQIAPAPPPSPPTSASPLTSDVGDDEKNHHQLLRIDDQEGLSAKHEQPVPMRSRWDNALSRFTCFAAAVLGMYVVIVLGGLCLYWSESDFERMGNCAAMDEENELRTSIRLPPMVSEFC